jgi:hypothetical protein
MKLRAEGARSKVPLPLPSFDKHPQVRRGDQPERVVGGLPTHVSRGWSDGRPLHHQDPAALPQRLHANMARAPASWQK